MQPGVARELVAEPPRVPAKPNLWLNTILGAVVGLLLGIGLTFLLEFLDTSIKKMEDIERFLNLPVLGVVAREGELITHGSASPQHTVLRSATDLMLDAMREIDETSRDEADRDDSRDMADKEVL